MPVLHQMQMSGNCYKVRLTARQLGVPITLKEYPLHASETRKPDFLAKNPNGRVPLLEFEDGRTLPESDAIIWYLAVSPETEPGGLLLMAVWPLAILGWALFNVRMRQSCRRKLTLCDFTGRAGVTP